MQTLANGVVSGLAIAVLALAFAVVYLPTRVFYLTLAGIYVAVPYICWTLLEWGWSTYAATLGAGLAGLALSVLAEILVHYPLDRKNPSPAAHLASALVTYIVVVQTVVLAWGNNPNVLR